jgi:hypothetical protein
MSQTIIREAIPIGFPAPIAVPTGSKVLSLEVEMYSMYIHFVANYNSVFENRTFQLFGFGQTVPDDFIYCCSVYHQGQRCEYHLFEKRD